MTNFESFVFATLDGYERSYQKHLTGDYGDDRFVAGAIAAIRSIRNTLQDELKWRLHLADQIAAAEVKGRDNVIDLIDALRRTTED